MDTAFWITAVVILVLLCMSAFFSASETSLTAASKGKLKAQVDRGTRGAATAMRVMEDSERMIGAILLGNNVLNILSSALATALLTRTFGDSGVAMATFIMTVLILVFGEVLPKTLAILAPESLAMRVAAPIRVLILLFSPVVTVVRLIVRAILRLFGVTADLSANVLAVREEIAGAIQLGHSEGVVEKEDRDRILGALDLADRTVEEIMLHRSGIEMIDASLHAMDIMRLCLNSRHTRLPLYKDDPENIVGVLHAKDMLRAMHKMLADERIDPEELAAFDVLEVAMEPWFVPETTTLDDQMRQFLKRHTHFALVVDEYGALQGLITLEDILEEIVGEIADEFDVEEEEPVARLADGSYVIDGGMTIRDINRLHDWNLPDDEANTIAGLVIHEAQIIPAVGQVFSFHGFRFEVAEKDGNRIATLRVRPLQAPTTDSSDR